MEGLIFGVFRYANSIKTIIEFQAKTHYYHQSQLQLFLDSDILYHWCDFVVATRSNLFIERTTLCRDWVSATIHELENSLTHYFVLPGLVV